MLRIAIALTFFGHGVKVLFHSSSFLHLISASELNVLGTTVLNPQATLLMLDFIAIVDLIAALLIVSTRWPLIPIYMGLWTFVTASSRVLANGPASWDDIVIRAAYYGIPLAILCFYHWQEQQSAEQQTLPAEQHVVIGRSLRPAIN